MLLKLENSTGWKLTILTKVLAYNFSVYFERPDTLKDRILSWYTHLFILAGYTTKFFAEDRGPGGTNTREIIHHFQAIETSSKDCGGDKMISFLNAMGWTYSEYKENISWLENLIRGHFNDEEIPVLRKWFFWLVDLTLTELWTIRSHNDATTGNVMMDKNDTSGESLLLIDFDLATYGYRLV